MSDQKSQDPNRAQGMAEQLNARMGVNLLTGASVLIDDRIVREQPDVYGDSLPVDPAPVE